MVHETFHDDDFRQWWANSDSYQPWRFREWKNAHRNKVAVIIKDILDWDRML